MRPGLLALAFLIPVAAAAQSPAPVPPAPAPSAPSIVATANLAAYERGPRLELSYGLPLSRESDSYGTPLKATALVAVRFGPPSGGAYRLWVRWAQRKFGYPQATQDMAAVGFSSDASVQLARKVSLALSLGAGVATVVHTSDSAYRGERSFTALGGLGLRFPYVMAEMQVLIIGGDLRAPLMVGIRL